MSSPFSYVHDQLHCGAVPLASIAARTGTPVYVYSADAILARYREYDAAFGDASHQVCYAVKANSNLAILNLLARAGAGFDIVSGGELFRVLKAGGDPRRIVFSGVGKTEAEIDDALGHGILSFNCESNAELDVLSRVATRRGQQANVALRVNPDVDASTHPYISTGLRENKFGIDIAEVEAVYARAAGLPGLRLNGVSCHIGSQLLDTRPLLEALDRVLALIDRLRAAGHPIRHLDFGGGLGVPYQEGEQAPDIAQFIGQICGRTAGRELELTVEPGRSMVAEAGVLVTQVLYTKRTPAKEFVIVDAAMNDLIRPSLYRAYHAIRPVVKSNAPAVLADIVGPVCESGDFLAKDRTLAAAAAGDFLAIETAGAYGFVQASNYNTRPRVAEVLVEGSAWRVVRERESYEDLVRGETI
ncbi:MAG: diaminopimelate decarboxylase [Bryobacteraceae bacterium]|nr:diaminopimelate decarboxylase [Bryobacteraceae bacterium]